MNYEQKYIVQEGYRDHPSVWWDDPDQPEETKSSLKQAIEWLADDFESCVGHQTGYSHRIIKRITQECYSECEIDNKLSCIKK